MEYTTRGTCSRLIKFDVDGDKVKDVQVVMGCHGNTQGVAKLVEGMDIHEAISRIEGIKCGYKATSCPDQLSLALKEYLSNNQ